MTTEEIAELRWHTAQVRRAQDQQELYERLLAMVVFLNRVLGPIRNRKLN